MLVPLSGWTLMGGLLLMLACGFVVLWLLVIQGCLLRICFVNCCSYCWFDFDFTCFVCMVVICLLVLWIVD